MNFDTFIKEPVGQSADSLKEKEQRYRNYKYKKDKDNESQISNQGCEIEYDINDACDIDSIKICDKNRLCPECQSHTNQDNSGLLVNPESLDDANTSVNPTEKEYGVKSISPVDLNSIDDCTFVAPKGEFKAHTDTVNNTVKPKLFDEQLLECAKNNFEKGRQFERDKILEEFIKRILKNKSLDSRSQQIAIIHLREITGLIYREQLNSKKSLTNSSEDKND